MFFKALFGMKHENNEKTGMAKKASKDLLSLTSRIGTLGPDELAAVRRAVERREKAVEKSLVESEMVQSVKSCPHCGGGQIVGCGSKGGRRRFKCKAGGCGKTFNAFTGTALAGLHAPDRFLDNARCMVHGMTVRDTGDALGVHRDTAFRWRHRFLTALERQQPQILQGLVEADETYFRESFKGQKSGLGRAPKKRGTKAKKRGLSAEQIPVLVARERGVGSTLSAVLPSRGASDISSILAPKLAGDSVLMADGIGTYDSLETAAPGVEVRHVPRNPKHKTKGAMHINNVNAYHRRLKNWMLRFSGVATKYLPNYLGWHRWLDAHKAKEEEKPRQFLKTAVLRE